MAAATSAMSSAAAVERHEITGYVESKSIEDEVQYLVQKLLEAKPANPRQFLLDVLEQELAREAENRNTDEISEEDMQKLFEVTRRITSEIVPQETIEIVITETLKLLNCDAVSLFCLDKKTNMLVLHASNLEVPIRLPPGKGIAGHVFNEREVVNIPDCYDDDRFDKSHDAKTGYTTKSLLAVPILDFDGSSMGVIQAINKKPDTVVQKSRTKNNPRRSLMGGAGVIAVPFLKMHEKIAHHLTQHVAVALRNAEVYREANSASERATGLLNTVQSLSQDLGTQSLILTITMHANKIVCAQRSTVFLVDEPKDQLWSVSTDTGAEIRIPKSAGIAGQCCCEGVLINIPDAYADSRFNQAIDKKTGFKTVSILAIPLFNIEENNTPSEKAIGVIQMINKVTFDGAFVPFDDSDIEVMELFASFVGPKMSASSLTNSRSSIASRESEGERALGGPTATIGHSVTDSPKKGSAGTLCLPEGSAGMKRSSVKRHSARNMLPAEGAISE